MEISSDWNFKYIQNNIEAIKSEYEGILLSFFWNEIKEKYKFTHETRNKVFSLNKIQYWQRERLWEVMNGDLEIEKFRRLK